MSHMYKVLIQVIALLALSAPGLYSQGVSIGQAGVPPDPSAALDIQSASKGLLMPRLTTEQQKNIPAPATGLIVLNIDSLELYMFNGTAWSCIGQKTKVLSHCAGTFTYGGQTYSRVQIGKQCWMKENLNIGTRIPASTFQTDNEIIEKHCYNNIEDSCTVYGGLYQWNEMMQYVTTPGTKGICPIGYHIATTAEWDTLAVYLGGSSVAGGKLKETGYRHWKSPNTGATNSSGYTAIGGGTYRPVPYSYFYLLGEAGIYWTSSTSSGANVWREDLNYTMGDISPYSCEREHSFSVRCMRN
jgi:uncharacterized protein (TIGR02145 family)